MLWFRRDRRAWRRVKRSRNAGELNPPCGVMCAPAPRGADEGEVWSSAPRGA
jgi:hypothetical protein